jgi:spore germination cell wall hydrolase CwlJ-like protein
MINLIVAILALAVLAPCHAKEVGKQSDLECLARNIYYEAGSEPEEGKVAVGLVTINRSNDERFPNTICGVVNQKTIVGVAKSYTVSTEVTTGIIFKTVSRINETRTVWVDRAICQFSWRCENARKIKANDDRWDQSVRVAEELLAGGYDELRDKLGNIEYFHSKFVRPAWAKQKQMIYKVGGHIFYAEH